MLLLESSSLCWLSCYMVGFDYFCRRKHKLTLKVMKTTSKFTIPLSCQWDGMGSLYHIGCISCMVLVRYFSHLIVGAFQAIHCKFILLLQFFQMVYHIICICQWSAFFVLEVIKFHEEKHQRAQPLYMG